MKYVVNIGCTKLNGQVGRNQRLGHSRQRVTFEISKTGRWAETQKAYYVSPYTDLPVHNQYYCQLQHTKKARVGEKATILKRTVDFYLSALLLRIFHFGYFEKGVLLLSLILMDSRVSLNHAVHTLPHNHKHGC
jgi:hypothetical protein